jgi:cysteine/serine-rich nuclear protein
MDVEEEDNDEERDEEEEDGETDTDNEHGDATEVNTSTSTNGLSGAQPPPVDDTDDGQVSSDDDDDDDEDLCYLQPMTVRERKQLLRASGIVMDVNERTLCADIRSSRAACGCECTDGVCVPASCACARDGIQCQVGIILYFR